jgi:hypothetical protein
MAVIIYRIVVNAPGRPDLDFRLRRSEPLRTKESVRDNRGRSYVILASKVEPAPHPATGNRLGTAWAQLSRRPS